ncbi:MAG TPA: hypothetical protein PK158_14535, partial [Spirochaetota bacterium]|nr:hypothetical protein [Spirochaetota bacterium]
MPKAKLYFIPFEGAAKVVCEFKERYIWQIALHQSGDIYAVSGENAVLYKITPDGQKSEIYKNDIESNFTTIAIQGDLIYFGSEGIGALYQYNITENKIKVLYETYEREITSLRINPTGEVFFVTGKKDKMNVPEESLDYTDTFVRQLKGVQPRSTQKVLKNSLYVYNKNKQINKLFTKDNFIFHSLAIVNNAIYLGTGINGVIFKINADGNAEFMMRFDESHVTYLFPTENALLVGTGNTGRVYEMGYNPAEKGIYTSAVIDTKAKSRWGHINIIKEVPEGTNISIETRSGNTSIPDNTWSEWKETGSSLLIKSPQSQYLQFRIIFTTAVSGKSPTVSQIMIPFLKINRAPEISLITFKRKVAKKQTGVFDNNICTLSWSAYDADNDELWYKVLFKEANDSIWLIFIDRTDQLSIVFDTRILPDGNYNFKVIASDNNNNTTKNDINQTGIVR